MLQNNPLWFYCMQNAGLPTSHCGAGMVYGANTAGKFPAFKQKALDIGAQLRAAASSTATSAMTTATTHSTSAPPVRHTITVGDLNGDTIYTPDCVVRTFLYVPFRGFYSKNFSRTLTSVMSSSSYSNRRITLSLNPLSTTLARSTMVITPASTPFLPTKRTTCLLSLFP